MPTQRTNAPIGTLAAGDTVTGFALLTKKELRQDKNGRDFLDMELADASGSISGKAWSDSRALDGDYTSHDFVAFRGSVQSYRDQLQLNVKECRRVTEADRQHGFDEALLIPSTREDLDDLESRLGAIVRDKIARPELRRVAEHALEVHGAALREHPAAKSIHHAYRGGLLEHTVSMAELALGLCAHYSELDSDLVLLGVLFHDLGKIRELGAMPVNEYTQEGRLVGHVVIGRDLLREACAAVADVSEELRVQLEHLVLSHQGQREYGSPVTPMTAEAFALHFIDNLDSKLAQLRQARERGAGFQFIRSLGGYVYLGEDEAQEASERAAEQARQAELEL